MILSGPPLNNDLDGTQNASVELFSEGTRVAGQYPGTPLSNSGTFEVFYSTGIFEHIFIVNTLSGVSDKNGYFWVICVFGEDCAESEVVLKIL